MNMEFLPQNGGCTCGDVRYRINKQPLFVHCCHCSWCQRETGTAFALNALIEAAHTELLSGITDAVSTPTNSGRGQNIVRCSSCQVAVWSNYSAAREAINFIRVGTLDKPGTLAPDIHIFTSSKQPWVKLSEDVPIVEEYYRRDKYWPRESVERYDRAVGR